MWAWEMFKNVRKLTPFRQKRPKNVFESFKMPGINNFNSGCVENKDIDLSMVKKLL